VTMLVVSPAKKEEAHKAEMFRGLYLIQFVFALTVALPTYIMSSFLATYAPERIVGLLYVGASVLSFILITSIPRILTRFGNYATGFSLATLLALLTLVLAFANVPWFVFTAFIFYIASINLFFFTQDIFIEHHSSDGRTGSIRGAFLTLTNIAFLISPFMAGSILTNGDYWKIFSLTSVTVAGVAFLLYVYVRKFKDATYDKVPLVETFKEILRKKHVTAIFIVYFLLRFFYAWMVIYSPLYLHTVIGLSWNDIGIVFTAMLVPFVLLALPAGHIADKHWGEKELLVFGFIVAGIATILIGFIEPSAELWRWIVVFVATRIGASFIETMSETYFFKHVASDDTHIIALFRNTNSLAYIVGPLIASTILIFFPFTTLFMILGGTLLLVGIPITLTLKDTK
jgi:MFS family permease